MKKYIVVILSLVLLASCGSGSRGELKALAQADSLRTAMARQDTVLNSVFVSLNEILENLKTIKHRESVIAAAVAQQGDFHTYALKRIPADIDALDSLLQANRRTITQLHGNLRELKGSSLRVVSLEKLIDDLSEQINANGQEVMNLRRELGERNLQVKALSTEVGDLTERGDQLEQKVRETSDLLNIAYYVADTQKELLQMGVVYKKGFIGRTFKVNENCSLDSFIKVDTRTFNRLRIDGLSPELLSTHPQDSYEFVKDSGVTWLNILDKPSFWKYTRVLVVSFK